MKRLVGASLVRGSAAMLAALLLSSAALAGPRATPKQPCCVSEGTAGDAPCCCMGQDASPVSSSAGCCRMSAPEEAAPSLTSPAAPDLAAPTAAVLDLPVPALPRCTEMGANVAQLARGAPLHLLYSSLLV